MLTDPKPRNPLHKRAVTFSGFAREDGLWDIEGHLLDTKGRPFTTGSRTLAPGEAVHDMWVRLTVDKNLIIQHLEVSIDAHPHPECVDVMPGMDALIGERIGKGWRKIIDTHIGGLKGCTHLRELLTTMATAVYQSIPGALHHQNESKPPLYLGTCKTWDFDGPVVMRVYPKFYRWKAPQ